MKLTSIQISFAFAILLVGGAVLLSGGSSTSKPVAENPVSVVDGKQIIDISAKGGYSPREITAKAGIATVLRVATSATFDCSSALTIPAIGYRGTLPQTGTTDIAIPPQEVGATVQGICAMGMYNFSLMFN